MFCKKCGIKIPDNSIFCSGCGFKVGVPNTINESQESVEKLEIDNANRKRHGFTTFWLWLMLVFNFIAVLYEIYGGNNDINNLFIMLNMANNFSIAVSIIQSFMIIYSVILLMYWKKIGFWLFVICGLVGALFTGGASGFIALIILFSLIGDLILFAILNLRNENGISTWDYLKDNNPKLFDFKGINITKKSIFLISSILITCFIIIVAFRSCDNTSTAKKRTLEEIGNYIIYSLNLERSYSNLNDFLNSTNIQGSYNVKENIIRNTIHSGEGFWHIYYITWEQYEIIISAFSMDSRNFSQYNLESMKIELKNDNYLNLFPYRKMKDYKKI